MKTLIQAVVLTIALALSPLIAQVPADANTEPTVSQVSKFRVPTKNIYIYLDNSATIVKDADDRPSVPLGDMLLNVLSDTDFTTPEDMISIINFGSDIKSDISVTGVPAKNRSWVNGIENFKRKGEGDLTTNLVKVFDDIITSASKKSEKIQVFIVASDFVHDPENKSVVGVYKKQVLSETKRKIDELKRSVGDSFLSSSPTCYLFLIQEVPTLTYGSEGHKKGFSEVSDQTIRWLQNELDATLASKSGGAKGFVRDVTSRTIKWAEVEVEKYLPAIGDDYPNILLKVTNNNSGAVTLKDIGVALEPTAAPTYGVIQKPMILNPGENLITMETLGWDRSLKQDVIYVSLDQDPTPDQPFELVKIDKIPKETMRLVVAKPMVFYGLNPTLVVKAKVMVPDDGTDAKHQLRFDLVHVEEAFTGSVIKLHEEPISVSSGIYENAFSYNGSIDLNHPELYKIRVQMMDRGKVAFESERNLSEDKGYFYFVQIPVAVSYVVLFVMMFMFPTLIGKKRVQGFNDRLLWLCVLFLLFPLVSLAYMVKIEEVYTYVYAVFPSVCCGVLLFKVLVMNFETKMNRFMKSSEETPVEHFIHHAIRWPLVLALFTTVLSFLFIQNVVF